MEKDMEKEKRETMGNATTQTSSAHTQQESKFWEENHKSESLLSTQIISPFYSVSFSPFFISLCCLVFVVLTMGGIKSCYGNKQGVEKKRKNCHPYGKARNLTFLSRQTTKRKMEEKRRVGWVESVFLSITRLLFELERSKTYSKCRTNMSTCWIMLDRFMAWF